MKTSIVKIFAGSGIRLAVLSVLLLGMAGACQAQASASAAPPTAPAAAASPAQPVAQPGQTAAPSKPAPKGTQEGIKMHGHWVIDVKNPDGTLAQHRAFENSLAGLGPQALIGLMAGYYVPGDYMIWMRNPSGSSPCVLSGNDGCGIVRTLTTQPALSECVGVYCATGLTYTYNLSSAPYSMVLVGSITADQAGSIGTVNTFLNVCYSGTNTPPTSPTTTGPTACVTATENALPYVLSSATLSTPIPVASGQLIQVTVTITFS